MANETEAPQKIDDDFIKETTEKLFRLEKNVTVQILHRIWFRNILYYMGEQWFEWARSQATFRRIMPSPYTPTPVSNIIRDHIRSMKALILNKDYTVSIWPNSNDQEDREAAEIGEQWLRWFETSNDEVYLDELEKIAIWTVLTGTGFDRTYPSMEEDKWAFDADGNPINTGNVISENISPFSVAVDHYGDRLKKKRHIGIKSLKPREWVEDTFKVLINANAMESDGEWVDYERKLAHLVANVSPWKGDGLEIVEDWQDVDDLVLLKEIEFKPTPQNPKGYYAGMVGSEIAFQYDRMPIMVEDDGTWEYTVTDFHYHYVPGRFWSDASVNDLISPQNSINQIDQDLEVNRKGPGRPIVLVTTDLNMKKLTRYGQSITVLQYDGFLSGGQKPEISRGTALPAQVLAERDIHRGVAQDSAGDPKNILRGKSPQSGASGIMVDILRDAAEQGHQPDIDRFYRSVKRQKRKQLMLAQEIFTEERLMKIPDKGNKVKIKQFKGADLRNNTDVQFQLASGVASTQAGKTQMLLKLTEQGFFNADNPLDPEYRMELMRRMGLTGFRDKRNVDLERARGENALYGNTDVKNLQKAEVEIPPDEMNPKGQILEIPIIEGVFLSIGSPDGEGIVISDDPLFKYDDHKVHYEVHRRYVLGNEFKYLPEAIQEIAIAHADIHKMLIDIQAREAAEKMAAMQAAATPPEPGPGQPPGPQM